MLADHADARGPSGALRRREKLSGPLIKEFKPENHPNLALVSSSSALADYGHYDYKTLHFCSFPKIGIDVNEGNIVNSVISGSPAADSGFQLGDQIVKINSEPVRESC